MNHAKQLYEEAIGLDFLQRFPNTQYVTKIGLVPLIMPAGKDGYEMMLDAANKDYAPAQYSLGVYYLFERHHQKAAVDSIEDPYARANALLALEAEESKNGIALLKKAAEQNNGEACLLLGDIFCEHVFCGGTTRNVTPDNLQAVRYYAHGAAAGNMDAMYRLGCCHYYGWGTAEGDETAFKWFCNARDAGCKLMWCQLGECYMNGYGTGVNISEAIHAFEQVFQCKDERFSDQAKVKLATIFAGYHGTSYKDFPRARKLLESVPESSDGYEVAQEILNKIAETKESSTSEQKNNVQRFFPLSYWNTDTGMGLLLSILGYILGDVVVGIVVGLLGQIPLLGLIAGLLNWAVGVYIVVGIVLGIANWIKKRN